MTNQDVLDQLANNVKVFEMMKHLALLDDFGYSDLMDMFREKWFDGCEYAVPMLLIACRDNVVDYTLDRLIFTLYGQLLDKLGAEEALKFVQRILCDECQKMEKQQDAILNASIFNKKQRT